MRLRTGRRIGRNLHLQAGCSPAETDRLVGAVDTPELAAFVVQAVAHMVDATERRTAPDVWTPNATIFDRLAAALLATPTPAPGRHPGAVTRLASSPASVTGADPVQAAAMEAIREACPHTLREIDGLCLGCGRTP